MTLSDQAGAERETESALDPWPAQAFARSVEVAEPADSLPLLWHWLYFLESPRRSEQGHDGHPRKGDFYPPVPQPRRMFVGGESLLHRELQIGRPALLRERIARVEEKQGSSGPMTLLGVCYEYYQADRLCIEERRNFMYLPGRAGAEPEPLTTALEPVPAAPWQRDVPTDPVLLFKFSALTFNGHRIHYDPAYAQQQEAYPATVVHGPLTAMLLAELARQHQGGSPVRFQFRARAPLFCGDLLRLRGEPDAAGGANKLTAYRPDGSVAMTAEAQR